MLMVYVYGILVGCEWDIEYGIYEVEESGMEYQLSRLGGSQGAVGIHIPNNKMENQRANKSFSTTWWPFL